MRQVKSGGSAATWSAVYSFKSGYSSADEAAGQPTKVAIFGDMGVYSWNNMGNMLADTKNGEIDLVIQMGDHCYNLGGDDDRRGDGCEDNPCAPRLHACSRLVRHTHAGLGPAAAATAEAQALLDPPPDPYVLFYTPRPHGGTGGWKLVPSFLQQLCTALQDKNANSRSVVPLTGRPHIFSLVPDHADMEAYQPVLSQIPWLPIVGNHEFLDGEKLHRYLNQTEGSMIANPKDQELVVIADPKDHALVAGATTTATSALGRLLATGNHHGIGTHGAGKPHHTVE